MTLLDVRRWLPRPALVEAFGEVGHLGFVQCLVCRVGPPFFWVLVHSTTIHIKNLNIRQSVGAWIHAAALGRDAGKGVFTRPPPQTLIVEASFNQGALTGVRTRGWVEICLGRWGPTEMII